MVADFSEIIGILEAELVAGQNLQRNLDAQKQAILDWDVDALLSHVEAREAALRDLGELEAKRLRVVGELPFTPMPQVLSQLIAQVPRGRPERKRLRELQTRSRKTFFQLCAADQKLEAMKRNMLGHIRDAMSHIKQKDAWAYGESGRPESSRASSELINEKV